jgi:hypothetical protein
VYRSIDETRARLIFSTSFAENAAIWASRGNGTHIVNFPASFWSGRCPKTWMK